MIDCVIVYLTIFKIFCTVLLQFNTIVLGVIAEDYSASRQPMQSNLNTKISLFSSRKSSRNVTLNRNKVVINTTGQSVMPLVEESWVS
jgi:tRNA threonylcarbamoyladenosine modification (KEOPS) complex  Pcc1 subunit